MCKRYYKQIKKNIMETNIQKTLESNNDFIKTRSSILPSVLILSLSAIMAIALKYIHYSSNESEMPIVFITAILVFTAWGAFAMLTRKMVYVHLGSKQKLIFSTINIELADKEKLKQILTDGNTSLLSSIRKSDKDALQLHIAYTPNNNVFLAQLSVYVPYEYVNASTVVSFEPEKAAVLKAHFIDRK